MDRRKYESADASGPPPFPGGRAEPGSAGARRHTLLERVRDGAANRPGVYRFMGPRGEILYVGKSVRIRARLLSYFRSPQGDKGAELLRVATAVEWEYLPNEFEALLREFRLIRAFQPSYNVQHRRDRRYAWVRLSGGAAPRLSATREPSPGEGTLFGPFPARRSLPAVLRRLAQLQGLRDCAPSTRMRFADQLDLLAATPEPLCPRADLGSCLAPCAARCSEAAYHARVNATAAFLKGEGEGPLERLRSFMEGAAREREYEMAARYRDDEAALRELRDRLSDFRRFLEELTFVYRVPRVGGDVTVVGARGHLIRQGEVLWSFDEPPPGSKAGRRVASVLRESISERPRPPASLSAGEREELFLVARWFRERPDERLRGEEPEAYVARLLDPDPQPSDTQAPRASSG